jgi:hypothetical protein
MDDLDCLGITPLGDQPFWRVLNLEYLVVNESLGSSSAQVNRNLRAIER